MFFLSRSILKRLLVVFCAFVIVLVVLSFKLLEVPKGLTIDEASFGYNAVLLSKTLRDENGRLLPLFVLSIDGGDWRQPIFQYLAAGVFKILDPSIFNLRLVSVAVASLSIVMISFVGGIFSSLLLFTTPVFFIHSHLALDNLIPVPFIISWLFFLKRYLKLKNLKSLIFAAFSLGIGFYGYKGVRVFIPIWILTSSVYIYLVSEKDKFFKIKKVIVYWLALFPFFAIIPYLEFKYAGAILNNEKLAVDSIYTFLYRYFATFDPSFLYVSGDVLLYHSTGRHGMFLLATLPVFVIGLIKSWKKGLFEKFVIVSFFAGTFLFGLFGSIHRSSRMISEVPLYVLISTWGLVWFRENKRLWFILLLIIGALNFLSFYRYYLFVYPEATKDIFYSIDAGKEYKVLYEISKDKGLTPYVDAAKIGSKFSTGDFIRSVYFPTKPATWDGKAESLPRNSVVMTDNLNVVGLNMLPVVYKNFVFYTKE